MAYFFHGLRWLATFLLPAQRRFRAQARLLALATLVGIVAGLGAIVFYLATRVAEHYALGSVVGYHATPPAGEQEISWLRGGADSFRPWLLLIVPTVGGLLSGWLVYTFAPEAEGHGTDSVIDSYHRKQGQIRPRVPLIKIVASALTIGTGGSGGREGPIAQIGAGFGSLLANLLRLSIADRRTLMAAGMGAGIAAIFRAPLAGALFASEVLYGSPEFEPEVIMPAGIASVVSYCTFGGLYAGWDPLFSTPSLTFNNPWRLGPYLLLVLFMIVLAKIYTHTFYGVGRLFHQLPVRPHFRPAIGAFLTGALGLVLYYAMGRNESVLAVLAFGYGSVQQAISGAPGVTILILLAISLGKILTTSLTIGSGGSGGVFGPAMVIGGCGGGAVGMAFNHWWPNLVPNPASFVIVGMAGFFAAAAKTPFSTLIIVTEMTGGYHLLLPALWVCVLAFLLSDKKSIYAAQVEGRSRSPAHQGSFVHDVLESVHVRRFLVREQAFPVVHPGDSLEVVLDRLDGSLYPVLPVVDHNNQLLGVVDLEEAHQAAHAGDLGPLVVAADLMQADVRPLTPEDTLDRALELFIENDLLALPIIAGGQGRTVIGMIRRQEIASAYLRHVHGTPTTTA